MNESGQWIYIQDGKRVTGKSIFNVIYTGDELKIPQQ